MIQLKQYQEKAVNRLLEDTYQLLKQPGTRKRMVLKAPTGAGKTVTMSAFLNQLATELPDKLEIHKRKVAFIWFAPNQLHLQSYQALKDYFKELRTIKPIQFEDVTDNCLKPNEVLFLNWQSVNKKNNLYIKENEQEKDLKKFIYQAMLNDTEIICILDEAHYHADGKKAQALLRDLNAKIEIDVSATPTYKSDYGHTIKRQEVIDAEMIKKNVVLNPKLDHHEQQGRSLNQVLLEEALKKREEIAQAYKDQGSDINPLLLIQLPNDNKTESALDKKMIEEVETFLDYKGTTTQNNKLAVWLSNEKTNLEGIEAKDSFTEVLLFKQAIALGWDCPRASVLLIYREINQETFGIQTVGRILRMPEQKHYSNPILNNGYVYTNLSKDLIKIVQEDIDYIVQNKAKRIETYEEIALKSFYVNSKVVRNRLGSDFRKVFYASAETNWNVTLDPSKTGGKGLYHFNREKLIERGIETNIDKIEISVPKDVQIAAEVGVTLVEDKERFAKTQGELDILFRQFCREHVGGFAKVDSTPQMEMALKLFFESYFQIAEFEAVKIILFEYNKPKFVALIDKALEDYQAKLHKKATETSRRVEQNDWEVPEERIYNEYYNPRDTENHALEPFYEQYNASKPEVRFVDFLQTHKEHIEWWYKNGENTKEHFAVPYENRKGLTSGFYVDFVIKLKDGTIALFDTKTLGSEEEFVAKHNAMVDYLDENTSEEQPLIGGIIVPRSSTDYSVWKYCENKIENNHDSTGWTAFEPSAITAKN
ncbi:DEAD/DEAH box helicase [Christiangramia sp. OXR-203]|uniref:DEAD/DEAH box helicase n=1 Tax=Christiangramia sp. OXR-203 TaxID=3100176 RepID=UPI002AC8D695|nr:DEAD/DEAH box helicase family protein [Christiangramia sp. OXR-203]WPY97065.1 DEAD/DEAH box helicase family protein [Christiangramia sp. OXR-203]